VKETDKNLSTTILEPTNNFIVGIKTESIELNFKKDYSLKDVRTTQDFLRVLKELHVEV
tara:strand:+ start:5219 stop:5395 length:177 start_codon:yes stop_codon:yes gene_type:complete